MSIRELASGSFQARLMIDGVRHSDTFATEQEAKDWVLVTKARSTTGALPRRVTVQEYAARWLTTYDAGPFATSSSTSRTFGCTCSPRWVGAPLPRSLRPTSPA